MASPSAVVRINDTQVQVRENEVVRVPRLDAQVGTHVEFEEVLYIGGGETRVGTPMVEGARVKAEIVEHGRGEKVIVFKMKRRKNYRRRNGHRQPYTAIRITSIEG
jgi:large subunit ribosomal protein L21